MRNSSSVVCLRACAWARCADISLGPTPELRIVLFSCFFKHVGLRHGPTVCSCTTASKNNPTLKWCKELYLSCVRRHEQERNDIILLAVIGVGTGMSACVIYKQTCAEASQEHKPKPIRTCSAVLSCPPPEMLYRYHCCERYEYRCGPTPPRVYLATQYFGTAALVYSSMPNCKVIRQLYIYPWGSVEG